MCGIIGKIDLQKTINTQDFNFQRDLMVKRGPDDADSLFLDSNHVALGFRRLSIIDLSKSGSQPIGNESNTVFIVCNGEIYNYKELRIELQKCGHVFKTATDVETILHGYEEWGYDVLNKLVGMFAFAIYDSEKHSFFIARDRFGVKPLYYYHTEKSFMFASSLKPLSVDKDVTVNIDPESLINYLTYRYVPSPKTIYINFFKLEPAHYLVLDYQFKLSKKCYWKLKYTEVKMDFNNAVERAEELLKQSVLSHLESDVSVGSFLSGGLDSSSLVSLMKETGYNPTTFSIGFSEWDKSEHEFAELLANHHKLNNYKQMLSLNDCFLTDDMVRSMDEPLADISIIPTYYVSKLASQKVKTVFSGEGSDEIFGGYNWYYKASERANDFSFFQKKISKKHLSSAFEIYCNYAEMGKFDTALLKNIVQPEYKNSIQESTLWFYEQFKDDTLPLPKMLQYIDIKTFMAELVLVKIDRFTMANSLEARVPFLDHRLVEFVFSLHPDVYFNPKKLKSILSEIVKDKLPQAILKREKQGFVGPDKYYDRTSFYRNELQNSSFPFTEFFQQKSIVSLSESLNQWQLWKLYVLKKWMETK